MRATVPLTHECSNECVFCSRRGLDPVEKEAWEERLAQGRASSDEVTFTGGEPLLFEGLADAVRSARAAGFRRVGLQTNGHGLGTRGVVAGLVEAGLTDVHLSLHGAEPAAHDHHVGRKGAFEQLLSGLGAARGAGLRCVVTTVLTRSNYRSLDGVARLLAQAGAAAWCVAVPRTAGSLGETFDRVMPRLALALPFALHALDVARKQRLEGFVMGAPACLLGPMSGRAIVGEERAYAPVCEGCPSRAHCPGVDERYLSRFKADELRARDTSPPDENAVELRRLFVGPGELASPLRAGTKTLVQLGSG